MIDDGFIVTDAIRLDEAANEARGAFEAFGVLPPDLRHPAHTFLRERAAVMPFYGNSVDEVAVAREDWIARAILPKLADEAIRNALIRGELEVWTADATGAHPRDHRVLFSPSECSWAATFATGRYQPVQGQPSKPPSYMHARLWLKNREWRKFLARLLEERGGVAGSQLYDATDASAVNAPSKCEPHAGTPSSRGRPLGSGYQRLDEALLEKMAELLANREVSSITAAAERVADAAIGASFDSKVRRLQRSFSARRKKGN